MAPLYNSREMVSHQIATRRYRMARRAELISGTRERIIDAAVRLHGRQGITQTSWAEIGVASHVSTATVYRHFPTLDDLVPACAQAAFAAGARLPAAGELASLFSGMANPTEKLEEVIVESCRCYERGEEWLDACRREARSVPALAVAARMQDRALDALISAAVGAGIGRKRRAALKALLDFPFWKSLVDAGVPGRDAPAIITDLALRVVERPGR